MLIPRGIVFVGGPQGGGGASRGYHSGGGPGGGGGGNDSEVIVQQDTIFVAGMEPSVTMDEIAEFFGVLGIIKVSYSFSIAFVFAFT